MANRKAAKDLDRGVVVPLPLRRRLGSQPARAHAANESSLNRRSRASSVVLLVLRISGYSFLMLGFANLLVGLSFGSLSDVRYGSVLVVISSFASGGGLLLIASDFSRYQQ